MADVEANRAAMRANAGIAVNDGDVTETFLPQTAFEYDSGRAAEAATGVMAALGGGGAAAALTPEAAAAKVEDGRRYLSALEAEVAGAVERPMRDVQLCTDDDVVRSLQPQRAVLGTAALCPTSRAIPTGCDCQDQRSFAYGILSTCGLSMHVVSALRISPGRARTLQCRSGFARGKRSRHAMPGSASADHARTASDLPPGILRLPCVGRAGHGMLWMRLARSLGPAACDGLCIGFRVW